MVLMKLKALQSELENVEGFRSPILELEQYMTSSHIAGTSTSGFHSILRRLLAKNNFILNT